MSGSSGRTDGRIKGRRVGRVIRNSIIFFAVVFIAAVLYLASSNNVLSISEADQGFGSSNDETDNIRTGEDGLSEDGLPFEIHPSQIDLSDVNSSEVDTSFGTNISSQVDLSVTGLTNELMLVNSENRITENFTAELSSAYRIVPLSTSDIEMNGAALEAVTEMFEKAKEKGYKNFFVNSGFRSIQKQKELYDSYEDKSFVQEPGASEHQTGYALDIAYNGLSGDKFEKSPQGKWLMENAHKYGFILRYPKDKTEITNISYEPWHYRYIGIPHSYYCYENDLCLEEYISFLAEGSSYSISIDKINYTVYYATENDVFIDVPADKTYKLSSDNTGGYAVVVMG
jgi:D-alanyl-D-alanine carboxypeptidase